MKIIDIFNLIANEEYDKLPKKIKYHDDILELNLKGNSCDYIEEHLNYYFSDLNIYDYLNDKVEIIEESTNDDISEFHLDEEARNYLKENFIKMDGILNDFSIKLNEVIRKVNKLNKGSE